MKWEKFKPPEPDDPMCCFECDLDPHGCCCDCDDLDEACSRWLKGEPQKPDCALPVFGAVMDRLRLRLLSGDRRVEISMVPALVLLPMLLRLAALHFLLGLVILTALPGLVLWYYYATHRKKGRTLFFLSLALFSLAYMYFLFITEILPRGDVSHLQLVTVTTGVVLTLISLVRTKRGPGFVQPSLADTHSTSTNHYQLPHKDSASQNGVDQSVLPAPPARPVEQQTQSLTAKGGRCPLCKVVRPPRAGHCRICGGCVQRLDHHCIWINSCVGQANHRSFLLTLLLFLLTSLYGVSLVLRSVCPQQNLLTALLYCPGVYSQYSSEMFSIPPNIAVFPIMSVSTKECLLVHYWSSAPLVLLLLCSGCFADSRVRTSGNITAKIGHAVTLSCEPSGEGNVSQVEWRIGGCNGRRILVSNTNNPVVLEQDYVDRVSAVTMHGFTLLGTQRKDTGPYCCSLTTFPLGSLNGLLFLYLSEDPQTAFSESHLIMIVSIASGILGVLLLGGTITALLLCQRCRRPVQDPVHVAVHPGGLPQNPPSILQKSQAHAPPPQRSNSEEEEEEENGEMDYLNVTVLRLPRIPPTASSALGKR